jgi:NADH:ubiquinone oxidoreductase subunit D
VLRLEVGEQTAAALVLGLELSKQTTTAVTGASRGFGCEHRAADKHCENNHYAHYIPTHLLSPVLQVIKTRQIPSQINGDSVPES